MQVNFLHYLCCPRCGASVSASQNNGETAVLNCHSGHEYPVIKGIPRFVGPENYASSFGFQWTKFRQVQIDSYNRSAFSEERFGTITGWSKEELEGKLVLDAGCGAGRFAEVVAGKYKANLVAIDLSSAVEACRDNLDQLNPLVCQASIYDLPFKEGSFDFVYCIGVIQHTPDPLGAIRHLCKLVKPGGQIGLWIYELNWKCFVGTAGFKYVLRPLTKRLPRDAAVLFSKSLVKLCYPLIKLLKHGGFVGRVLMRLLPVPSSYLQGVKLSPEDFRTWLFLDTFDMYTPAYDKPQRFSSVIQVLEEQGFEKIRRHPHGAISVTATRKP